MQRLGRAAAAVLQAHRSLTAEPALQQAAAGIQQSCVCSGVSRLQVQQCSIAAAQGICHSSRIASSAAPQPQWTSSSNLPGSSWCSWDTGSHSSSFSSRALSSMSSSSSAAGSGQPLPHISNPADAMPVGPAQGSFAAGTVLANRKARRAAWLLRMKEAGREAVRQAIKDYNLPPNASYKKGPYNQLLQRIRWEARSAARWSAYAYAEQPVGLQQHQQQVIQGICRRRNVKLGWKKIDFVLRMIRRSYVDDAMAQLKATPRKAAMYVMHAIANARNNAIVAGAKDPSKLYVAEAFVTKGRYIKRLAIMGRGYSSIKKTRKSHLNVKVQELDPSDAAAFRKLQRSAKLVAPIMIRQRWERQERPRLKLWAGRKLPQQMQQLTEQTPVFH